MLTWENVPLEFNCTSEKFHHALWLGLIPSVLHPWEASNSQRERLSVYYFQQSTWTPYSPHCFPSTVNAKPRVWKSLKPLQTRRDRVLDLSLTCSITLLTQYHFSKRLFSRFFDYSSISLLQNRLEKKFVRMDGCTGGRMHRIWPDLEAPGTIPRTPKRLPVTARSSQKVTHKCLPN